MNKHRSKRTRQPLDDIIIETFEAVTHLFELTYVIPQLNNLSHFLLLVLLVEQFRVLLDQIDVALGIYLLILGFVHLQLVSVGADQLLQFAILRFQRQSLRLFSERTKIKQTL